MSLGFLKTTRICARKTHKLDFTEQKDRNNNYNHSEHRTHFSLKQGCSVVLFFFLHSFTAANLAAFSVTNQAAKSWGYIWKSCSLLWERDLDFYTTLRDACCSRMQLNVSCRARETHLSLLFIEGSRDVVGVKVSPQKSWRRSFIHFLRVDTTYHI